MDYIQLTRTGSSSLCTHGKAPSGAIKVGEVIGQLDDYKLLNRLYVRHWRRLTVKKKMKFAKQNCSNFIKILRVVSQLTASTMTSLLSKESIKHRGRDTKHTGTSISAPRFINTSCFCCRASVVTMFNIHPTIK